MPNFKMVVVVAASLVALTACEPSTPPAANTAADEAVMHAATVTWAEAYNAGEVDRILTLYAEDAVVMPPNAPAAKGQAAIRAFLAEDSAAAKAAGLRMGLGEDGLGVSGNLAWHSGTYTVTDAADAMADTGKWVEIWLKADGKWHMIRDIWNSDTAPPAPESPTK